MEVQESAGQTARRQKIMAAAPIEYLVIAFPDGVVNSEIAPELAELVDKKLIRILDLVFVRKDSLGEITAFEFDELGDIVGFTTIDAEVGGLISDDDITFVGADLVSGKTAAVLLVEDLWAANLADALDRSGALLLEGARIPRDMADAALADLLAS
jgi:hypothetical protein